MRVDGSLIAMAKRKYKRFVGDSANTASNELFKTFIEATGMAFGLTRRNGESDQDFKNRVFSAMESAPSSRYVDLETGVTLEAPSREELKQENAV